MRAVEARVHGLVVEQGSGQHVVILREAEGPRILPIWIGPGEALAIQRLLTHDAFPRPLTHDLVALIVEGLKARVSRVVIADLRESTFHASIFIERDQDVLSIDARPSDSIAVALRTQAPLFVNEELLQDPPSAPAEEQQSPPDPEPTRELTEAEKAERLRRMLEKLDPEDFGKFRM